MKTITIGTNDAGQRLDKFLIKTFPNLPKSMLYKSIRKKDIKCNGKRCEISTHLQVNDTTGAPGSPYLSYKFRRSP